MPSACEARAWSSLAQISASAAGDRTRGARSSTCSSATGSSISPSASPRCSAASDAVWRSASGGGLLVLIAPAPVLVATNLHARESMLTSVSAARIGAPSECPHAPSQQPPNSRRSSPAGRGSSTASRRTGARSSSSPRPRTPRRPTRRSEGLRERGSPSHDGVAARLVDFRADDDGIAIELQPLRWALRLVAGDASPQRGRAVRHALGRRALAGRAPRAVGRLVGRALGARRRRRRRSRREPGRHARARARRGVGGRRPSACAARR